MWEGVLLKGSSELPTGSSELPKGPSDCQGPPRELLGRVISQKPLSPKTKSQHRIAESNVRIYN